MAAGGGLKGIVLGVSLTHWTSLTRIIRAEVMQVQEADYTKIANVDIQFKNGLKDFGEQPMNYCFT